MEIFEGFYLFLFISVTTLELVPIRYYTLLPADFPTPETLLGLDLRDNTSIFTVFRWRGVNVIYFVKRRLFKALFILGT